MEQQSMTKIAFNEFRPILFHSIRITVSIQHETFVSFFSASFFFTKNATVDEMALPGGIRLQVDRLLKLKLTALKFILEDDNN